MIIINRSSVLSIHDHCTIAHVSNGIKHKHGNVIVRGQIMRLCSKSNSLCEKGNIEEFKYRGMWINLFHLCIFDYSTSVRSATGDWAVYLLGAPL